MFTPPCPRDTSTPKRVIPWQKFFIGNSLSVPNHRTGNIGMRKQQCATPRWFDCVQVTIRADYASAGLVAALSHALHRTGFDTPG